MTSDPKEKTDLTFEAAFSKLEEILDRMNRGTLNLDDSLALFEESNALLSVCQKRLNEAEKKVEVLLKNRQGEPILGEDGKLLTQEFKPQALS